MGGEERYKCNLSSFALATAVAELNEPEENEKRLAAIDELKVAFRTENPDIEFKRNDDLFFLRFLRAKKFKIPKALEMITNYHKRYDVWPEVIEKVENDYNSIKSVMESEVMTVMDGKAKDGSTILVFFTGKNDLPPTDLFSISMVFLEHLLDDEEVQIFGLTMIQDLTYFGVNMVQFLGPSTAMKSMKLMQNCMPVRVKCMNFVNEPTIFTVINKIFSSFTKEKMKPRVRIHGANYAGLQDIIDPTILPEEFSGSGKPLDYVAWKELLFGEETAL